MAYAIQPPFEDFPTGVQGADPLRLLAGRRYTCYCGRSVIGSILCRDCAEEMAAYYRGVARRRLSVAAPASEEPETA